MIHCKNTGNPRECTKQIQHPTTESTKNSGEPKEIQNPRGIQGESKGNPKKSEEFRGTEKELELLLILLAVALIDSKADGPDDSQHHHLRISGKTSDCSHDLNH